ncbi:Aste57867_9508 [Aphanomyces stellatus]|uniref:Aste57867_9508 protein n=1 Tax=Aphanomyces stellatus TaxID=120398 RepID=A0A485KN56_9STRA|nr:hypothetical protein As57867_009471 [Aphanomyces stellatus]VFT86387.1 Aste57867_9508 [Aphanomyces stellatus]
MKTFTSSQFLTITLAAVTTLVEGGNHTHQQYAHFTAFGPPVFAPFSMDSIGVLPTDTQLEVVTKWSPAEFTSHTSFYLYSPRSPRNSAASRFSFKERSRSANFTEIDVVTV